MQVENMAKETPLSQGKVAIVDDHWYEELSKWPWYYHEGYAIRKERVKGEENKWKIFRMHRVIMGCDDPELVVDHINGDKLDNREENLRIATRSENNRNVKKTWESSSRYKGVTYAAGAEKPWIAQIGYGKERIYLGAYYHEREAASIYNLAAKKLFGQFADVNDLSEPGTKPNESS